MVDRVRIRLKRNILKKKTFQVILYETRVILSHSGVNENRVVLNHALLCEQNINADTLQLTYCKIESSLEIFLTKRKLFSSKNF